MASECTVSLTENPAEFSKKIFLWEWHTKIVCPDMLIQLKNVLYSANLHRMITKIKHPKTNVEKTIAEWASHIGIGYVSMCKRLRKWPLEEALSNPKRYAYSTIKTEVFDKSELIRIRKKIGLKQLEVSKILDIGYSTYVRMESGKRPVKKIVVMALKYYWFLLVRRKTVALATDKYTKR